MEIELNQIFSTETTEQFESWRDLTKGRFDKPLNRFKGMPYFTSSRGITPVINFYSNPFKEEENQTPWRDLILQEEGRVVYNGDKYQTSKTTSSTFGNKLLISILGLYSSAQNRIQPSIDNYVKQLIY